MKLKKKCWHTRTFSLKFSLLYLQLGVHIHGRCWTGQVRILLHRQGRHLQVPLLQPGDEQLGGRRHGRRRAQEVVRQLPLPQRASRRKLQAWSWAAPSAGGRHALRNQTIRQGRKWSQYVETTMISIVAKNIIWLLTNYFYFAGRRRLLPDVVPKLGMMQERPSVHTNMATLDARLASFANWPQDKTQKPSDLAEAGFFYNGTICI